MPLLDGRDPIGVEAERIAVAEGDARRCGGADIGTGSIRALASELSAVAAAGGDDSGGAGTSSSRDPPQAARARSAVRASDLRMAASREESKVYFIGREYAIPRLPPGALLSIRHVR
jgi:hypothetical protein